jgi:RNA polymerase sigma-70 factor (ECF subfamily)
MLANAREGSRCSFGLAAADSIRGLIPAPAIPQAARDHEPGMKLSREQFETMALEQLDLLYRVARRLTRREAAAEDLVQETYLRALRAYSSFDLKEFGIRPWLLRILHNLHSSRGQRESRQPQALDDEQLAKVSTRSDLPPLPAGSFDGMDQQLVRAVSQLPQEYQSVLLLWALEDLSYKEIAEAVDVPIGTVMSRLHRARQRLVQQLHDYAREEGIIRE